MLTLYSRKRGFTLWSMRAVLIERQGEPVHESVHLALEHPDPLPKPGEVVVRTEAAALNHLDLWVGRGLPGLPDAWPKISGSDGCGIVDRLGEGVDPDWLGRRVVLNAATFHSSTSHPDVAPAPADISVIGEHGPGTMAEFFVAPADQLLDVGEHDPVEAAACALSYLTAWRMLRKAGLRAGDHVLITGIGGGVALATLDLVRHFGAHSIVTSRSAEKLARAASLGAAEGILDTGEDWSRVVRQWTKKRGVDVAIDSVGKAAHLSCVKSLRRGGTLVLCGCTSGPDATTDLARVFWNQLQILGSTMGDMGEFREVVALMRTGALHPVIDTVVAPEAASGAYARLESGDQFGKVVVDWRG